MKHHFTFLVVILKYSIPFKLSAQTSRDASVEISAQVQTIPPRITLNWIPNPASTRHVVYRKLKTGTSWGTPVADLSGLENQYMDTTVLPGISYEYRVLLSFTLTLVTVSWIAILIENKCLNYLTF